MTEQEHTASEPQAPQPKPRTYVYAYGQCLPCLESMEEVEKMLDDAEPGAFIELTVNVQQPEVQQHAHQLFALIGVNLRDGFTRARYRENTITGYIELLPPAAE